MHFNANPKMLKEVNSSVIEKVLYEHGPLSKPIIARITNLSLPTVSKIVDDLEARGFVYAIDLTGNVPGRNVVLYQINKDYGCIIALYYFWGDYLCRITDMTGNSLFETLCEFDNSSAEAALYFTRKAIDTLLNQAQTDVKIIGVGVPGAVMPDGRLLAIPKIEVWEDFNLEEALSESYSTRIYIENDVKLSAVCYYHTHLIDEFDNLVYIYVGNGINSGIIINKKLFLGSTNFAGQLGFMASLGMESSQSQYNYTHEGGCLEKMLNSLTGVDSVGGIREKDALINLCTMIAANCIAIINPTAVIFSGEAVDMLFIEEIKTSLLYYTPERNMPQIIYDDSENIGLDGLVYACIGEITK